MSKAKMNSCEAVRKDGQTCGAPAQAGKRFCFFHDPEKAAEVKAAKSAGGKTQALKVLKPAEVDILHSPTIPDIVDLLCQTVADVRAGRIDPKVANAVGYLSNVMLKAMEAEALGDRLAALEEAVGVGLEKRQSS